MNSIITFLTIFGALNAIVYSSDEAYAQGNLEVIFQAKSGKSGEDHPQKVDVPSLWCQARSHETQELVPIKRAHFVRASDQEVLPALIVNNSRAVLEFGTISVLDTGKYKCEITTDNDGYVWGWLFVNMRPVFHTNHSKNFETDDQDNFRVKAPMLKVTEGETVVLNCPVYGYPKPSIEWFKDDVPVASTEQITFFEKALQITKVQFDDDGIYSCVAKNSFAKVIDGKTHDWESRLDRELKVRGSYRWVYPLILIAVILLLLFIIIYACSIFNRHKTYNVEKRERRKKRHTTNTNMDNANQQQPILSPNKNEIE